MLKKIKSTLNPLLKTLPFIGIIKKVYYKRRFKTEINLLAGKDEPVSTHPSIIHFSFNKAATQYVKDILSRCAGENGLKTVGYNDYAFHTNLPYLDHLDAEQVQPYAHIFRPQGYLYSVFGGMVEGIPSMEKYKIVLIARDPRDILVSNYYSMAFSHKLPDKKGDKYDDFISRRSYAQSVSIDEYVKARAEVVFNEFYRYQTQLLDKFPHTYLTSYESMVLDFENWLKALLQYCELKISDTLFQAIVDENKKLKPKKEDVNSHLRKGMPGGHKDKLKPETIHFLNEKLAPVLERFNYN